MSSPPDPLEVARHVLQVESEAISSLAARLGPPFRRAVELVLACRGRVVVTGLGKSGLVGKKLAATLAATGTPALFLHPVEGLHGDLGMLVRGDLLVALSNSGETGELLDLLPAVKRLGLPLVVLTGRPGSRLAQEGDVVLDASVAREACPLNLTPTASAAAALALGDALAIAVLTHRGLSLEDVSEGMVLQIDRGAAFGGDHAVPDIDTGRPQQIRRLFIRRPDVHRQVPAGVVRERPLPLQHDWRLTWRAQLE